MLRLLAALFGFFDKALGLWRERKLREQGRQQAIKEAEDEAQRQAELAEWAVDVTDPARDERLRDRFDRARSGQ